MKKLRHCHPMYTSWAIKRPYPPEECPWGARLPYLGLEPVGG